MNSFDLMHPADQLVLMMERIYTYGMTTTSGGNLSILEDNGDLWITPSGIDKGSLTRQDIVRVKHSGEVEGIHKPSVELPFHQMIYQKRSDIKAIIHAHPPTLIAFSIVRRIPDTSLIPNAHFICGETGMAAYATPGSRELGQNIADEFAKGHHIVVLENHGVVCGSHDLFTAFMAFETLDFCGRLEIKARRLGQPVGLSDEQFRLSEREHSLQMDVFIPQQHSSEERNVRREMCKFIHRAYEQKLFTSTQGTFSQRMGDGSFLITPHGLDRKYMDITDLVRIHGNQKESGKDPSHSAMLHRLIYEKNPDIQAVIIAHPPNIMAFAVTQVPFETKTIPESYVMLRNIPKLPYGTSFTDLETTAASFSHSPVVMIENDCIIAAGQSLLNAFDRLEVAEYSAKSILAAKTLGELVLINQEEIQALHEAFGIHI